MNEAERTQSSVTQSKDIALDSWHNFSTMELIKSQDVLLNATIKMFVWMYPQVKIELCDDPNTGVEVEVKVICNHGPGNIEGKSQNLND